MSPPRPPEGETRSAPHEGTRMTEPIHVVDATMFWSATGAACAATCWPSTTGSRSTPAGGTRSPRRSATPCPAWPACRRLPLPGCGGYRLPLRRGALAAALRALRARRHRSRRSVPPGLGGARRRRTLRHPGGRVLPLQPRALAARWPPARSPRRCAARSGASLCRPPVPPLRPRARAQPKRCGAPARLGRRARRPASRWASTRRPSIRRAPARCWRSRLGLPPATRAAGLCRPLRAREAPRRAGRGGARGSARPTCCSRSAPGRRRRAGDRVHVLPFIADAAALARVAGQRRCLRACRRPGDLRPVGAGGDGLRHAGGRARTAEGLVELVDGSVRRWRCDDGRRATASPRRSRRCSSHDRAGAAARAPGRGPSPRLEPDAAAAADALPAPAERPAASPSPGAAGGRSKPRPCRRHDDRRAITPSRFESERFVCVVLHDVAPATRAGLRAHARRASREVRRRAAHAAGGAALPLRALDARASLDWLGERYARRRRAGAARLHATVDDGEPRGVVDRPAAPPLHPRRRRVLRPVDRPRRRGASAPASRWFRAPRLAARRLRRAGLADERRHLGGAALAATCATPARCASWCCCPTAGALTSQSVVYSTRERVAPAGSLAWNATVAARWSATTRCCASSCIRATPTRPGAPLLAEVLAAGAARPAGGTVADFSTTPVAAAPTLVPAASVSPTTQWQSTQRRLMRYEQVEAERRGGQPPIAAPTATSLG